MKTETIDEIKGLLDAAKRLRNILPDYTKCIADPNCDKHDLSFTMGKDSTIFQATANLSGYRGYYGNSSCSPLASIQQPIAQKYLVRALNKNMELILNTMAELVEADAAKLKEAAQKELDTLNEMVSTL